MSEVKAMVIRAGGDSMLANKLVEGVNAAEVVRLRKENEYLRAELKRTQERVELYRWARDKEAERKLAEYRERETAQAPLWVRLVIGLRLRIGRLAKERMMKNEPRNSDWTHCV